MKKITKSSEVSWNAVWGSYTPERYKYQLALEEHRVRWQRIQQIILDRFGSFSGLNCIDIGAGAGHNSILFAQRGANVTLLDYSKKALEFSQNVFKNQGISENNVQFIHMDALRPDHSLFNKYEVAMSFGVAEHFRGLDREKFIKSHYDLLKKDGLMFINVPCANCIPFYIYQSMMKLKRRNVIECYAYSKSEFIKIASKFNIINYDFIGSSYLEAYNPISFYKRKCGLMKDISKIKEERQSRLDKYLGKEITFYGEKK